MGVCFFMIIVEKIERTVQIEASTVEIEERGVKLRLTVVDTPGYGDAINSQDWSVSLVSGCLVVFVFETLLSCLFKCKPDSDLAIACLKAL